MVHLSDAAQRFVRRLPVVFVVGLIAVSWLLFTIFVSVKQVLIARHETWRFALQIVVFTPLALMSLLSYTAAVSQHPIRPDQTFAPEDARPLLPDELRPPSRSGNRSPRPHVLDDDDIPLRVLRNSRAETRVLTHRERDPSPLRHHLDDDNDMLDVPENQALLDKSEGSESELHAASPTTVLMAKGATGGPRWCRKCDGWKPDRCHHCRSCMQCVLKMDHHCPWLDNCVGYHNYKPFILFLTYASLLCAFAGWQAGLEVYYFFKNPFELEPNSRTAQAQDDFEELRFALTPVIWMVLSILAFVFGLGIGGMAGYHWYLLLNNRTTLEDMNRSVPTALLDPATRAALEDLGARGTRRRQPGAWRPDHILTRPERTRLRSEAREINVYDVGWQRNLRMVMCGDGAPPVHTLRELLGEVRGALWPLSRPKMRQYGAGHFFEHDPAAVTQLKSLTSEMRLGLDLGIPADQHVQRHDLGEWTIGQSDSESDDDE